MSICHYGRERAPQGPDKLNIYVKRILEGSVAGMDTRIKINDHIVQVSILNPDPTSFYIRSRIRTFTFLPRI